MEASIFDSLRLMEAIEKYVSDMQELNDIKFARDYENLTSPEITVTYGFRYARIVSSDRYVDMETGEVKFGSGVCVHSFIDMKTGSSYGDVLKPAGWKAPAKHARGNVFTGYPTVSAYGPAYLR